MNDELKKNILFDEIKNMNYPYHIKSILTSINPFGFSKIPYFELATYSDGKTHIGVRDYVEVLKDDKEFLCRNSNYFYKSVFMMLESLINDRKINFIPYDYKEPSQLVFTTDIGVLTDEIQELYNKYLLGLFVSNL